MDFQKQFGSIKRRIRNLLFLEMLGCCFLMYAALYHESKRTCVFALVAACAFISAFLLRHFNKVGERSADNGLSKQEYEKQYDRYSHRCVLWLIYLCYRSIGTLFKLISLGLNAKTSELAAYMTDSGTVLMLIAFFCISNWRIADWIMEWHVDAKKCDEKNTDGRDLKQRERCFQKKRRSIAVASLVYGLAACALFVAFDRIFVLDINEALCLIYFAGAVVSVLQSGRDYLYMPKRTSKILIAGGICFFAVIFGYQFFSRDIWLVQPFINATPYINENQSTIAYDEKSGVYTMTKAEGDFKILQLTDIHLGGGILSYDKDLKALQAIYDLLVATKPDLVVVTGDLTYPVGLSSFSFNNSAPVQQFAAFMRNTGIPWAFTYGNHDTENYAATSAECLDDLYQSLSFKTSRTLLYPYVQPDISGRNNQLIEIRNGDGTLRQALFLIDSNAYTGEGFNKYDYIHDDQVEWYREQVLQINEEEKRVVPSLIFCHIPLQEYRKAYDSYQKSEGASYIFGFNGEGISCSEHPSGMFEAARELGSTTDFFCGHDHYNNLSLEYEGIRLTYGMSIDYLVMAGIARHEEQRGGTLITVKADGSSSIEQVPLASCRGKKSHVAGDSE